MTITAGFRVRDGILMCSDTMYTGVAKIHQPKLFSHTIKGNGGWSCVFGLAGHEGNAVMAIQDCEEAIADLKPRERTFRTVKMHLRSRIKAINTEYVDARAYEERSGSRFELIIAFWLAADHTLRFFCTRESALIEVGGYQCIGSGQYLGDFLIRPAYQADMSTEHALLLATRALAAAKAYEPSCGGSSTFALIRSDGSQTPLVDYDASEAEKYIATSESLARQFTLNIGNTRIDDETFERNCRSLSRMAADIRRRWKGRSNAWGRILQDLTDREGPPNRASTKDAP